MRQEGASLPPEVDAEITALAESDMRFGAALSAVRSPSRSVGQLPPATGQARLSSVARELAVGGGTAGAAAAAAAPAPASPPPAPAAPPRPASDPYDAEIGDEASWGIVEDFDEEPGAPPVAPPPAPREEQPAAPKDSAWQPDPAGPSPETPEPAANCPSHAPAPTGDDPLDGWDEVDWEDDDRSWTAGGADPAAGTPLSSAIPALAGETRPFDVVGAGLADPEPEPTLAAADGVDAELLGPDYAALSSGGELPPRSPWRFLVWFLALALLIGGVALAIYVVGKDRSGAASTSTIEQVAPSSTTPKRTTPKATTPKRTTPKATTPKATTPKRTSSSSSGSSSTSARSSSGGSTSSSSSASSAPAAAPAAARRSPPAAQAAGARCAAPAPPRRRDSRGDHPVRYAGDGCRRLHTNASRTPTDPTHTTDEVHTMLQRDALEASPLADLHELANEVGLEGFRRLRKADLIDRLLESAGGTPATPAAERER